MSQSVDPFVPFIPDFKTYLMPEGVLDNSVNAIGMNLGWCRAHACPCTLGKANGAPGSANPMCKTCFGRGIYWDDPVMFLGLLTYMHTSAAPDEPGVETDPVLGQVMHAAPTLSIPFRNGDGSPCVAWPLAGEKDAYIETDATARFQTPLLTGSDVYLPYRQNLEILAVTAYDATNQVVVPVDSAHYTVTGPEVILDPSIYPDGTGFVVDYIASPVYVGFRRSGGIVHSRPAGQGAKLPRRFHLEMLDVWMRTLNNSAALNSPV